MGLFDRFKKKENIENDAAYVGNPQFYTDRDGKPFGAFALTEGTLTCLPKNPKQLYKVDNAEVNNWKILLISITDNGIIGDVDYYETINKLKKFVVDETDNTITINGLSAEELKDVMK